jgi:hypothetical protein
MFVIGSELNESSINIAHFVPIRYQTWPPQAILVSDWLISKKNSPLKNEKSKFHQQLHHKHELEHLYNIYTIENNIFGEISKDYQFQ